MENYKLGSKGAVVKQIQKALKVYPDGIFGKLTEEAVKSFQRMNGLKVDGIVGPGTLFMLLPSILIKSKRNITEIIIHCTATREGQNFTVDQIRTWHKNRGFSDIGYHYIIDLQGKRFFGRDIDISGAHTEGHNTHSIGIAYIGGIDCNGKAKDTRTNSQKDALMSLLFDLRKLYPKARILGHRDCSKDLNKNGLIEKSEWVKECPSFDAKKEYEKI